MSSSPETASAALDHALEAEAGLCRGLRPRQLSMIALGGAIGTGLFLGSAISVQAAGPGVIVSYTAGALVAASVAWSLAEMAAAFPVAGSFGVYADIFLHPWAGFTMRYSYWLAQAVAVGSEAVAVSIYCREWLPQVPGWVWVTGFSLALVFVNARTVASFGEFEYWFAMIKVATIVVFLVLGCALIFGVGFERIGFANYTRFGGFLPRGWRGVGLGVSMAIFSYLGTEAVAVTAGEAQNPEVAVPRAMRSMFGRLALFYIGGVAVLVGVMPWTQAGLSESPFVRVFKTVGIPAAAALMNFVVLTAALSSMNTNLYLCSRMLFSLARGGYAPGFLGHLSRAGSPVAAIVASSAGMALALVSELVSPKTAYLQMLGAAFFGGLFVWMMILATHIRFRRRFTGKLIFRAPFYPWASASGIAALAAITISTWWVPGMKITLIAGLPWLAFISLCYLLWPGSSRRV
ncbi:MAG: amino acid permease [Acidobacteria bacterium]|nr:MAG: amino acid permease [Acidobacteriota bacterium]